MSSPLRWMTASRRGMTAIHVLMAAFLAFAPGGDTLAQSGSGDGGTAHSSPEQTELLVQRAFAELSGEGSDPAAYQRLLDAYERLDDAGRRQTAQILSMVDATYGRYQDAKDRYLVAFPSTRPADCPEGDLRPVPAIDVLRRIADDADVVMINESHSLVATRSLFHRALPVLRDAGYDYLALEALFPEGDETMDTDGIGKRAADSDLAARGYPIDKGRGGHYLREPLYAEVVREALRLGFQLVAYEAVRASSKDARETEQARTLAAFLDRHLSSKLAVFAGYSHIYKSDGWMADRLARQVDRNLISIDQVSGLGGCRSRPMSDATQHPPIVFVDESGRPWSHKPDHVDFTIFQDSEAERTQHPRWLTLNGTRFPVAAAVDQCNRQWPCIISAYYNAEASDAVPADRVAVLGAEDLTVLFLAPGKYRLEARTPEGASYRRINVAQMHR